MANTPVNGIGWYLKDDGTLIVPWKAGESGGSGNVNNPYNNVTGYWGTSLEPNGTFGNGYLNSITQVGYGVPGRFALGQRPDSYLGLTQSPIIDQQRQNIATKSKIGYGGTLGRYQFANNATPGSAFRPTQANLPTTAQQSAVIPSLSFPNQYAKDVSQVNPNANTSGNTGITPPAGYQLLDKQNALHTNREIRPNAGNGSGGLLGAGPVDPAQASAGYGGLVPNNTAPDNTVAKYMQQGKVPVAGSSPMNWVPTTNVPKQTTNVGKLNWSQLSDADLAYAQSLGQQDPGRYKNFLSDAINWGNANMASELMRVDYNTPIASMDFNNYNGPLAALAAAYNGSKNYTSGKK